MREKLVEQRGQKKMSNWEFMQAAAKQLVSTPENVKERVIDAATTSFIDYQYPSEENLRPKLLYNDTRRGNTVLANLENELVNCQGFWFSVAFITKSGLIVLKDALRELELRGIKGKILTTDYLQFNDPAALRELLWFENLEVKIFTEEQFHTKGYMFWDSEKYTFVVGSSNLTQTALKANKEWNLKVTSLNQGELIYETNHEFELMWSQAQILNEGWIREYEVSYKESKKNRERNKISRIKTYTLKPNKMQEEAMKALGKLRDADKDKALLISATGTGKTYLSAFDVRNINPKKLLFLVHREQILIQAEESFKDVLGDNIKTGFLSGSQKQFDADYLFSTTNMMSKESIYQQFPKDYFEYIIIDETHRAGANSYCQILNYFKPKFLLGMTATPERTDGIDIYKLFDHNIAYEIRLQQALEENMLCPFHYFGISELTVNGKVIDDMTEFKYLVSQTRVDKIIETAEFYGYSGNRVRGLVFCSRTEEAKTLSELFNRRGYQTAALVGTDSQKIREEVIERLEQNNRIDGLDYIFTVDIMNEGVDIPCVNQIIMLRPTQSAIIFIQQLGRGLRKHKDKDYVVVIDFIGNYQKNFLIPIALSGDRSYNKDTIRRYVAEGNRIIPGCSTVRFDEMSKRKIYDAIDSARLNEMKLIKDEYNNLKYILGRIPNIDDFDKFGSIDIIKIFDKMGSYYRFLVKYDGEDYTVRLSSLEDEIIMFLSQKIAKGKRIHELEMIKRLLYYHTDIMNVLRNTLDQEYGIKLSMAEKKSVINNLTNSFSKVSEQEKYSNCIFIKQKSGNYSISGTFAKALQNPDFYKMVEDLVDFGIVRYRKYYANRYKDTNFELYQKYTYEDVCRLLNWEKNMNAQNIGGYFYEKTTKTMPVFINYVKEEGSIAYEDRFISPSQLIALSKRPRKIESKDAEHIYKAKEEGNRIFLFVRKLKDDKEAKEFYFLGEMNAVGKPNPIIMKDTSDDAFEINYRLHTPVREDIYEYLTN